MCNNMYVSVNKDIRSQIFLLQIMQDNKVKMGKSIKKN